MFHPRVKSVDLQFYQQACEEEKCMLLFTSIEIMDLNPICKKYTTIINKIELIDMMNNYKVFKQHNPREHDQ